MKLRTREALVVACPFCEARPGETCRMPSGKRRTLAVHDARGELHPPPTPRLCPNCGEAFAPRAFAGHRQRCGVDDIPNSIWRRSRPTWGRRGSIYLIETVEGPARIKVGIAGNAKTRLSSLLTGSPVELRIRAIWPNCDTGIEWDLHRLIRSHWVRGEWFDAAAAVEVERYMEQPRDAQ